jgi:MoaA/NifB/PqqE/SkfB family radical SAM enzyme
LGKDLKTSESSILQAKVDDKGRLILPAEAIERFGLLPGCQVRIDLQDNGVSLRRPITHLAKIYVEPTSQCNLACRTCIRNSWNEPSGQMSEKVFDRLVAGLGDFDPPPKVFFGGFGEPLVHPRITEMVAQIRSQGSSVELITNGILLNERMSKELIEAGINVLWISVDGATPESYSKVRIHSSLPEVLANVRRFRHDCLSLNGKKPQIGLSFVAMRSNVDELPDLMRLGIQLGVSRYLVTNVLPYTQEMCKEMLYTLSISVHPVAYQSPWSPLLELPRIDLIEATRDPLYRVNRTVQNVLTPGQEQTKSLDRCPFIESGSTTIGWDGGISPCLPLMHSHRSFLNSTERLIRRYVVGNLEHATLQELWIASEYQNFRRRVEEFEFSPCVYCGGCDFLETNREDCFGNTFPVCGGCLWAQGIIQCP